ncbi:hypothetical protein LXA43DRAFT_1040323 [Ganoderma leucocontextum]|nr:hypothetical protein LXA43DRAFT_1040323 [Ganoderma leucocontextum]
MSLEVGSLLLLAGGQFVVLLGSNSSCLDCWTLRWRRHRLIPPPSHPQPMVPSHSRANPLPPLPMVSFPPPGRRRYRGNRPRRHHCWYRTYRPRLEIPRL